MSADAEHESMTDAPTFPLDEDGDVHLPIVEVLTGRAFVTGKSGSGKSNTASVIVEELLDAGYPVLIVDTDGEYWGLKEQYEILHVGADEECDLQVGPEHASKLADLALDGGVPIILDVSGYLEAETSDAIVRETARELFAKEKKLKRPFLLLVEEVHEFIPEGGGLDETGEMLIRIGKRGRKRGLGLVGISQRPADVKKDFITQCDWLVWHRLTWQNDTDVVRSVIDSEASDAVQDLDDGEALLMADFLDADLQRVQVRRKRTFDAGETPDLDEYERPELKSVSGDLVDELEEISQREERRQDRVAQLEARVEKLQEEKATLEEELEDARDLSDMARQFSQAMMQQGGNGDAAEQVDELIEERNAAQRAAEQRAERVDELEDRVTDLQDELEQRPEIDERAYEAVVMLAEEFGVGGADDEQLRRKLKKARERVDELEREVEQAREGGVAFDEQFDSAMDFVRHPSVQEELERATKKTKTAYDNVLDVVLFLADESDATHADLAAHLDVTESTVRGIMPKLAEHNIVTVDKDGNTHAYNLNTGGLEEIVRQHKKREEMTELRQELKNDA